MNQDQAFETCHATIEQRSPLHGARYQLKSRYVNLMSAIAHNDPFTHVYHHKLDRVNTLLQKTGH